MADTAFNAGRAKLAALGAALTGWKVMLVAGYTPDKDHTVSTIAASEIASTTGYTAGYGNRLAITITTPGVDNTNDCAILDATDLVVANLGVPAGVNASHAVLIREVTDDAGSEAWSALELNAGSNRSLAGGQYTFQFGTFGLVKIG